MKVTSNLNASYKFASQIVSNSFVDKEPNKVMQALVDLVEATVKDKEGTF